MNKRAALAVYNKTTKTALAENPLYRDFNYGKSRDGYWDGNHASIQLEDFVDFFHAIFRKEDYFLTFELDHSQAHKRHSIDAFIPAHFNLNPGGSVPIVRDIIVTKYSIGSFHHDKIAALGDIMHHACMDDDLPPKGK